MNERDWKKLDDKSNPSVSSKRAVNQARDVSTGTTVTIKYKHSLAVRWMHWINFPLLVVMIYSGLLIYWADSQHEGLNAHQVYRVGFGSWTLFRLFPPWFYNNLHLKFQLAKGLGYHFFFMWFFALNGMAYVLYTFLSGEWRELLPTQHSFLEAIEVILLDLGLSKRHPPQRKFNGAQQIAYTGVILMGVGSLLTGLAIYKPTQLHVLTALLGGYEIARWLHFWLTMGYIGFFLVHVAQVIRAGWNNFRAMIIGYQISPGGPRNDDRFPMDKTSLRVERETLAGLQRRSRRGFLTAALAAVAGGGIWKLLSDQPGVDGLASPFRKAMELNAGIVRRIFRERALAPEFERSKAVSSFRRNGDIGLSEIRPEDWRLQLVGVLNPASYTQYSGDVSSWIYGMNQSSAEAPKVDADVAPKKLAMHEVDAKDAAVKMKPMEMPEHPREGVPGLLLTMADVKKLPHVEMVTEFKCIEGWSEIVYWGGARLRDFLAAFPPLNGSRNQFDSREQASRFPKYVGFETPDGQYYVGIEREVALHPQTLLAYEMNGQPLTPDHGAPLRLVTPLKYGIKQLKQIGRITYTNVRPHDYWHARGYDYYAGL